MNPFLAFCLYVAARVFIQYLKSRREDSAVKSSLHFLLAAMQVLKTKNPLTESFLVQLDVDLEGTGLDIASHSRWKYGQRPPVDNSHFDSLNYLAEKSQGEVPANTDAIHCSPLFEIRATQGGPGMAESSRGVQPQWPDKNTPAPTTSTTESYPRLFNQQQPIPVNDCAKVQKMDHLNPVTDFSGDDLLYGQQGPSPGYVHSENPSSSTQSNQPTPASSSNRPGSYSNFTPPQPNQSAFSPNASGASPQPLFGSNLGANMGVPNPNDAGSWNFTAVHQNKSPQASGDGVPLRAQGGEGLDIGYSGRTGMTPGATGMTPGATGLTPGGTGMTPLPDSLWQSVNEGAGSEWMYGWNAGTPSQ